MLPSESTFAIVAILVILYLAALAAAKLTYGG